MTPLLGDHLGEKSDPDAGSDELQDEIELAAACSDRRLKAGSSTCVNYYTTYREAGFEQDGGDGDRGEKQTRKVQDARSTGHKPTR